MIVEALVARQRQAMFHPGPPLRVAGSQVCGSDVRQRMALGCAIADAPRDAQRLASPADRLVVLVAEHEELRLVAVRRRQLCAAGKCLQHLDRAAAPPLGVLAQAREPAEAGEPAQVVAVPDCVAEPLAQRRCFGARLDGFGNPVGEIALEGVRLEKAGTVGLRAMPREFESAGVLRGCFPVRAQA